VITHHVPTLTPKGAFPLSTFTVVLADPRQPADFEWINALAPAASLNILAPTDDSDASLMALLPQADALVSQYRPITAQIMDAAPRLKLIQRYGTRPDGIDLDAARQRKISVATMPLRGCIAVAELAVTLILALSKNLVKAHDATASGAYRDLGVEPIRTEQRKHKFQWMKLPGLLEVYTHTLGIIGFGEIGTETARRAKALGMEVIYNKRSQLPAEVEEMEGVRYVSKQELLKVADFVLLSTPLTPETEKMIAAEELAMMKPSAFLVNICRGGVIDEEALVTALNERQIAGAGLDVFLYEPIPHDHPLLQCDNVILTPHIGGGTGGARDKQMADVLGNVVAFAQGEKVAHQVV
jgi:phosphoglycerate dehydrogenase-like enzyme